MSWEFVARFACFPFSLSCTSTTYHPSMESTQLPTPPQSSSDIFSLSDQVLSDSLHFIEEASLDASPKATH
jgi:hypothetical protein